MMDKSKDQSPVPESARLSREVYLGEKEKREAEERLRREQQQQDRSLGEGLNFLFRSTIQFVFYVGIGAFVVIFGKDIMVTNPPTGILIMMVGAGLVIRGMMSLGGFNAK